MIGFILYEAMDLTWTFGKTVFDIIGAGYRWYYHIPTEQQRMELEMLRLTDKVHELEEKLDEKLENKKKENEEGEGTEGKPIIE